VRGPQPIGHLVDQQRLGLLGRDLGRHELEHLRVARVRRRVHPHPGAAHDDEVPRAHLVHRRRAGPAIDHHEGAVHLGVVDG
jgi:hypothetical protein